MMRTTIWRDLRWRLLAALLLVVPLASALAAVHVLQHRADATRLTASGGSLTFDSSPAARGDSVPPLAPGFTPFVDAAWFETPGPTAVFILAAVILGASGVLLRPRQELAFLLAQGLSRRRWLATNAAASLAASGIVILSADVVLAVGAWRAGASPELGVLLGRSLALFVAAGAWVLVTLGTVSLVRHPLLAATLVIGLLIVLPTSHFEVHVPPRPSVKTLRRWDPWTLADPRAWLGGLPWPSLVATLALGAAGAAVALYRVDRFEP